MGLGVPGKVLEVQVWRNNRLGLVEFEGTRRPVFLDLVPDAKAGDYVLVHVGFATERIEADGVKLGREADVEQDENCADMVRRQKQR